MSSEVVEVGTDVLAAHDRVAARVRARHRAAGTLAVNLVSSPGTGKTELLTAVLARLVEQEVPVAALVGDCATDNDARRLAASGAPVRQIVTEGLCHLEAHMVEAHLDEWDLDPPALLLVENVGNLVCPGTFDLGEDLRVVLLSVTEGEDKPRKYPQIFASADLCVVTKVDLAVPCEWDRAAALGAVEEVHPGLPVVETSARTGLGVADLADHLLAARRPAATDAAAVPGAHRPHEETRS